MEYEKVEGAAEIVLNEHDVQIEVGTCCFRRKHGSSVVRELLKEHHEDRAEGVGNVGTGVVLNFGSGVHDLRKGAQVAFVVSDISKHSALAAECITPRYFCCELLTPLNHTDVVTVVDALIPAYYALHNKAFRGDTVLICDAHTPQGQIAIQLLHKKGCKIIVYLAQELEKDMLGPYRHMVDSFFEGWIHRSNVNQMRESLINESDRLGFSLILCFQTANALFADGCEQDTYLHKGTLQLSTAIACLAAGGHIVLANDKQLLNKVLCQHLFAKGCSINYINPTAILCSPFKLGSLLSFVMSHLEMLGKREITPPQPIHKVTFEEAVLTLNNELDPMHGSYVVEM